MSAGVGSAGPADRALRRRMGEQERLINYLHRFQGLISVTVIHVRGPLTMDLARGALDYLQQRHPMLAAHVRKRRLGLRGRLPFVVVEPDLVIPGTLPIPLVTGAGDWREAARREGTRPLPGGRAPRARAVFFPEDADGIARLILTLDHAICDAQAAMLAVRDIMAYLGDPGRVAESSGLPPALEERYRRPAGSPRPYVPAVRLPARRVRGAPHATASEWRRFSAEETRAIRTAARVNGATLHSTMTAALLKAVAARHGYDALTVLSTVEFRRLCEPPLPRETFGCYIDILRTRHEIGGAFWPLARDVAFRLIGTLAKDQEQASILQLPPAAAYRHETIPILRSGFRLDALAVTSAGESGFGRSYGTFTLEDVTLTVSMHTVGPGLFAVSYEWDGALVMGACYGADTVPGEEVADILDQAAHRLRNLPEGAGA